MRNAISVLNYQALCHLNHNYILTINLADHMLSNSVLVEFLK